MERVESFGLSPQYLGLFSPFCSSFSPYFGVWPLNEYDFYTGSGALSLHILDDVAHRLPQVLVILHVPLHGLEGVDDGGMVTARELPADLLHAHAGDFNSKNIEIITFLRKDVYYVHKSFLLGIIIHELFFKKLLYK